MKWCYFILFSTVTFTALGQSRQLLTGIIVADGDQSRLSKIYVINPKGATETKTGLDGSFQIAAQAGDILTVYSTLTEVRQFAITNDSWLEKPLVLSVSLKSIELEEVVIERSLTSESLGIVPKDQRKFTPAERKLRTASRMTPEILMNNVLVHGQDVGKVIGVGVPTDAIINSINGKTKQLKKELEVEKKEYLLEKISLIYTDAEIIETLKIPLCYKYGFYYYLLESGPFRSAIEEDNETQIKFLMAELATEYSVYFQK